MKLATRILRASLLSGGFIALAVAGAMATTGPMDPVGAVGRRTGPTTPNVNCTRVNLCTATPAINGEAFVGPGLVWQTDFFANELHLVDLNNNCQILQRCPAPGTAPSELTLLNGVLYHYDFGTVPGVLYAIDPNTCQILGQCDPPGDDLAEGLTNDGQYLWKGDSTTLYKFTPPTAAGGGCQVVAQCPNPSGDSADGLTFCGQNLLMLGYSGNLYEIDPATCTVIGSCPLNAGASGNGITSDRATTLYVDDIVSLNLDRVDVGCDIPTTTSSTSWGHLKVIYR